MTNRRKDPRNDAQRRADDEVQENLASGRFLPVPDVVRRAAIERARRKKHARRLAAAVGQGLAAHRIAVGLSQEEVAHMIGTQRSAVSRVESGRHGGLSIESLLVMIRALADAAGDAHSEGALLREPIEAWQGIPIYSSEALVPEARALREGS